MREENDNRRRGKKVLLQEKKGFQILTRTLEKKKLNRN